VPTWSSPSSDVDGRVMAMLRRALPPPPPATVNGSTGAESVTGHTPHAQRPICRDKHNTHKAHTHKCICIRVRRHSMAWRHRDPCPPLSLLLLSLSAAYCRWSGRCCCRSPPRRARWRPGRGSDATSPGGTRRPACCTHIQGTHRRGERLVGTGAETPLFSSARDVCFSLGCVRVTCSQPAPLSLCPPMACGTLP
jgi:hypothetical protein